MLNNFDINIENTIKYIDDVYHKIYTHPWHTILYDENGGKVIIVDYFNFIRSDSVKNALRYHNIVDIPNNISKNDEMKILPVISKFLSKIDSLIVLVVQSNVFEINDPHENVIVVEVPCDFDGIPCYQEEKLKRHILSSLDDNYLFINNILCEQSNVCYVDINGRGYTVDKSNLFYREGKYAIYSKDSWIPIVVNSDSKMPYNNELISLNGVFYKNNYWININNPFGKFKNESDDMIILAIYHLLSHTDNVIVISGDNYNWNKDFFDELERRNIIGNIKPIRYGVIQQIEVKR